MPSKINVFPVRLKMEITSQMLKNGLARLRYFDDKLKIFKIVYCCFSHEIELNCKYCVENLFDLTHLVYFHSDLLFVDQDQDSPVFGTFPSSAKLSSEDLIKIKNEILFAKTKTANLESEFSVEKSLGNMNKTKREILASHGHDIYLQVFN
jgi:hypothetical protein